MSVIYKLTDLSPEVFEFLVSMIVKGLIVFAIAGCLNMLLRSASAAVRHLVWVLAFCAVSLLPLLILTVPGVGIPILPAEEIKKPELRIQKEEILSANQREVLNSGYSFEDEASIIEIPQIDIEKANAEVAVIDPTELKVSFSVGQYMLMVWLVGFAIFLWPIFYRMLMLWLFQLKCNKQKDDKISDMVGKVCGQLKIQKQVKIISNEDETGQFAPMVWGIMPSVLFLPKSNEDWTGHQTQSVLLHELAHIKRHDWLSQLFCSVVCAVYWFNPLAWYGLSRLRVEREQACDDLVINSGIDQADYAEHLVKIARHLIKRQPVNSAALAMARTSQIESRIKSILDIRKNRKAVTRFMLVGFTILVAAVSISIAAVQLEEKQGVENQRAVIEDQVSGPEVYGKVLVGAGNVPLASQQVYLQVFAGGDYNDDDDYRYYDTTTDNKGEFIFKNVEAGEAQINRYFMPGDIGGGLSGLYHSFNIGKGSIHQVTLGGKGRPVVGKLVPETIPGNSEKINWSKLNVKADMYLEVPHVDAIAVNNEFMAAMKETEGGDFYSRASVDINPDGTFRIENVRAGRYMLRVHFPERRISGYNLFHKFTVGLMPGGETDEALDLGELKVSNTTWVKSSGNANSEMKQSGQESLSSPSVISGIFVTAKPVKTVWQVGEVPKVEVIVDINGKQKYIENKLDEMRFSHYYDAFTLIVDGQEYVTYHSATAYPVDLMAPWKIELPLDIWEKPRKDGDKLIDFKQLKLTKGRHTIQVGFIGRDRYSLDKWFSGEAGLKLPKSEKFEIEIGANENKTPKEGTKKDEENKISKDININASITGKVVDEDGNGIGGAEVNLNYRDEKASYNFGMIYTDGNGGFKLASLPEDESEFIGGEISVSVPGKVKTRVGILGLTKEQRSNFVIMVKDGISIPGVLLDSNEKPIANVLVELLANPDENGTTSFLHRRADTTDKSGSFKLEGVSYPGSYTLRAVDVTGKQKAVSKQVKISPDAYRTEVKEVTIKASPIYIPDSVEPYEVLGMTLVNIDDDVREAFEIDSHEYGVLILDPGENSNRFGIGELKAGDFFRNVGDNQHFYCGYDFVSQLIEEATVAGGIIIKKPRVVYNLRREFGIAVNTQYMKLNRDDIAELKKLKETLPQMAEEQFWSTSRRFHEEYNVARAMFISYKEARFEYFYKYSKAPRTIEDLEAEIRKAEGNWRNSHDKSIREKYSKYDFYKWLQENATLDLSVTKRWKEDKENKTMLGYCHSLLEKYGKTAVIINDAVLDCELMTEEELLKELNKKMYEASFAKASAPPAEKTADDLYRYKDKDGNFYDEWTYFERFEKECADKFYSVYKLEEDENLKRIAPPLIPERMDYYWAENFSQAEAIPEGPDVYSFLWGDKKRRGMRDVRLQRWGSSFGSTNGHSIKRVIEFTLKIPNQRFEGSGEIMNIELAGDWIIREGLTEGEKLEAMKQLLAEEKDIEISYEQREVRREVIVAKGEYKYTSLNKGRLKWAEGHICLSSDKFEPHDPKDGGGGGFADTVGELIDELGELTGIPVVDEVQNSDKEIKMSYYHDQTSYLRSVNDKHQKAEKLKILLDYLQQQTNLEFSVEQRPVKIWFIAEIPEA